MHYLLPHTVSRQCDQESAVVSSALYITRYLLGHCLMFMYLGSVARKVLLCAVHYLLTHTSWVMVYLSSVTTDQQGAVAFIALFVTRYVLGHGSAPRKVLLCAVHYSYLKLTGHGSAWPCDQECAVVCSALFFYQIPTGSWLTLAVRPGMPFCVKHSICYKIHTGSWFTFTLRPLKSWCVHYLFSQTFWVRVYIGSANRCVQRSICYLILTHPLTQMAELCSLPW